jgi:hypothetical protein
VVASPALNNPFCIFDVRYHFMVKTKTRTATPTNQEIGIKDNITHVPKLIGTFLVFSFPHFTQVNP